MKQKIGNLLETFSKSMVQPLSYMSCAGVLIVIGVLLTNSSIVGLIPALNWGPIQAFGKVIYNSVMVIISNLSVIFVVGLPAALAKTEKHKAALVGLMSYLMYLTTSNTLLTVTGKLAEANPMLGLTGTGQASILGIQCIDMSVFGGIILGCITGYVFNRTCRKKFSGALMIYSGANFSFICMFFISILYGALSNVLWPFVQGWISSLGAVIKSTGVVGLFLYGFLERFLLPTGLHHLIYMPFQFSDLGGVIQLGDTTIAGAYPIVMAEMNLPMERFSESIYYMATGFTKMFGYIGIGAAFVHTAYPQNKKRVRTTMIPLVITACLASVTEPIDFLFCFVAPGLWLLHSCIAGLFIALLKVFDVTAFWGGNLISSILLNTATGVERTHYPVMFLLGIIQILVYFFLFSFLIKKFNLRTPGREAEAPAAADAGASAQAPAVPADSGAGEGSSDAMNIISGLGGKGNINSVENCVTRLRVNLKDPSLLNEAFINKTANSGIVKKGNDIQIIYGLQVPDIRRAVDEQLAKL